jgi:hypothetical protein
MEAHRLRSELLRGAATSRPSAPRLMFMLLVPGWRLDDRHRATEHEARRAADLFCLGGSGDSRPSLCQLSDPGGIRRRQRPGVAGLGIRLGLLERYISGRLRLGQDAARSTARPFPSTNSISPVVSTLGARLRERPSPSAPGCLRRSAGPTWRTGPWSDVSPLRRTAPKGRTPSSFANNEPKALSEDIG